MPRGLNRPWEHERHQVRLTCPIRLSEKRVEPRTARIKIDRRTGRVEIRERYTRQLAVTTLTAIADWVLYQDAIARVRERAAEQAQKHELRRAAGG